MVALSGSGATHGKPSVVAQYALGQHVATCGNTKKEPVVARARHELIRLFPGFMKIKHPNVATIIRRLRIRGGKGKASVVSSL